MSTPLLVGEELIGVLALYTSEREGFAEDQRQSLEAIAVQIAIGLRQARASASSVTRQVAPTPARQQSVLLPVAR